MKHYAVLTDTVRDEPFGFVIKDGNYNICYGLHSAANEWADLYNSGGSKTLEEHLPSEIIVSPFGPLSDSTKTFLDGAVDGTTKDIPTPSMMRRADSQWLRNESKGPQLKDRRLDQIDHTMRQIAIDYKTRAFVADAKRSSMLLKARQTNAGFNPRFTGFRSKSANEYTYADIAGGNSGMRRAAKELYETKSQLLLHRESFYDAVEVKALGTRIGGRGGRAARRLGRAAEAFDPDAVDADLDQLVQEGTPFERPALPSKPGGKLPFDGSGRLEVQAEQARAANQMAPKAPSVPARNERDNNLDVFEDILRDMDAAIRDSDDSKLEEIGEELDALGGLYSGKFGYGFGGEGDINPDWDIRDPEYPEDWHESELGPGGDAIGKIHTDNINVEIVPAGDVMHGEEGWMVVGEYRDLDSAFGNRAEYLYDLDVFETPEEAAAWADSLDRAIDDDIPYEDWVRPGTEVTDEVKPRSPELTLGGLASQRDDAPRVTEAQRREDGSYDPPPGYDTWEAFEADWPDDDDDDNDIDVDTEGVVDERDEYPDDWGGEPEGVFSRRQNDERIVNTSHELSSHIAGDEKDRGEIGRLSGELREAVQESRNISNQPSKRNRNREEYRDGLASRRDPNRTRPGDRNVQRRREDRAARRLKQRSEERRAGNVRRTQEDRERQTTGGLASRRDEDLNDAGLRSFREFSRRARRDAPYGSPEGDRARREDKEEYGRLVDALMSTDGSMPEGWSGMTREEAVEELARLGNNARVLGSGPADSPFGQLRSLVAEKHRSRFGAGGAGYGLHSRRDEDLNKATRPMEGIRNADGGPLNEEQDRAVNSLIEVLTIEDDESGEYSGVIDTLEKIRDRDMESGPLTARQDDVLDELIDVINEDGEIDRQDITPNRTPEGDLAEFTDADVLADQRNHAIDRTLDRLAEYYPGPDERGLDDWDSDASSIDGLATGTLRQGDKVTVRHRGEDVEGTVVRLGRGGASGAGTDSYVVDVGEQRSIWKRPDEILGGLATGKQPSRRGGGKAGASKKGRGPKPALSDQDYFKALKKLSPKKVRELAKEAGVDVSEMDHRQLMRSLSAGRPRPAIPNVPNSKIYVKPRSAPGTPVGGTRSRTRAAVTDRAAMPQGLAARKGSQVGRGLYKPDPIPGTADGHIYDQLTPEQQELVPEAMSERANWIWQNALGSGVKKNDWFERFLRELQAGEEGVPARGETRTGISRPVHEIDRDTFQIETEQELAMLERFVDQYKLYDKLGEGSATPETIAQRQKQLRQSLDFLRAEFAMRQSGNYRSLEHLHHKDLVGSSRSKAPHSVLQRMRAKDSTIPHAKKLLSPETYSQGKRFGPDGTPLLDDDGTEVVSSTPTHVSTAFGFGGGLTARGFAQERGRSMRQGRRKYRADQKLQELAEGGIFEEGSKRKARRARKLAREGRGFAPGEILKPGDRIPLSDRIRMAKRRLRSKFVGAPGAQKRADKIEDNRKNVPLLRLSDEAAAAAGLADALVHGGGARRDFPEFEESDRRRPAVTDKFVSTLAALAARRRKLLAGEKKDAETKKVDDKTLYTGAVRSDMQLMADMYQNLGYTGLPVVVNEDGMADVLTDPDVIVVQRGMAGQGASASQQKVARETYVPHFLHDDQRVIGTGAGQGHGSGEDWGLILEPASPGAGSKPNLSGNYGDGVMAVIDPKVARIVDQATIVDIKEEHRAIEHVIRGVVTDSVEGENIREVLAKTPPDEVVREIRSRLDRAQADKKLTLRNRRANRVRDKDQTGARQIKPHSILMSSETGHGTHPMETPWRDTEMGSVVDDLLTHLEANPEQAEDVGNVLELLSHMSQLDDADTFTYLPILGIDAIHRHSGVVKVANRGALIAYEKPMSLKETIDLVEKVAPGHTVDQHRRNKKRPDNNKALQISQIAAGVSS